MFLECYLSHDWSPTAQKVPTALAPHNTPLSEAYDVPEALRRWADLSVGGRSDAVDNVRSIRLSEVWLHKLPLGDPSLNV